VQACRDADDDKFLALALCGGAADLIVSGAADLLTMQCFRGIEIIAPAALLARACAAGMSLWSA
jgi:predicted nucleic acid-binding protein